jgi:hypothetical protein
VSAPPGGGAWARSSLGPGSRPRSGAARAFVGGAAPGPTESPRLRRGPSSPGPAAVSAATARRRARFSAPPPDTQPTPENPPNANVAQTPNPPRYGMTGPNKNVDVTCFRGEDSWLRAGGLLDAAVPQLPVSFSGGGVLTGAIAGGAAGAAGAPVGNASALTFYCIREYGLNGTVFKRTTVGAGAGARRERAGCAWCAAGGRRRGASSMPSPGAPGRGTCAGGAPARRAGPRPANAGRRSPPTLHRSAAARPRRHAAPRRAAPSPPFLLKRRHRHRRVRGRVRRRRARLRRARQRRAGRVHAAERLQARYRRP